MEKGLVGILNATPDSFSDGGEYFDPAKALDHAYEMFDDGASFIDVGAESTRPGATPISIEEERSRLEPIVLAYASLFSRTLSIDTQHPEIIRWIASEVGPVIINDVTAFNNPEMITLAAEFGLPCIVSHLPQHYGQDIQAAHRAEHKVDSSGYVLDELMTRRMEMIEEGVDKHNITLDPGIGFGKTFRLNWELLEFGRLVPGIQVMIGASRKKFLVTDQETGRPLPNADSLRQDRDWLDERSVAAGKIAFASNATLLRVHNVAAHATLL